ncbi:hypothetical protein PspTeo4_42512 [Pseudomonas sp. Teo4]|nr:hypothetical protein [Pseudomonas sp. Teo4]
MNTLKLDALKIDTMHSGRACLNLTSCIDWDDFPDYASAVVDLLNGKIETKSDSIDIRIWEIIIEREKFHLTFDDFPVMVSLESMTPRGDSLIAEFEKKLAK